MSCSQLQQLLLPCCQVHGVPHLPGHIHCVWLSDARTADRPDQSSFSSKMRTKEKITTYYSLILLFMPFQNESSLVCAKTAEEAFHHLFQSDSSCYTHHARIRKKKFSTSRSVAQPDWHTGMSVTSLCCFFSMAILWKTAQLLSSTQFSRSSSWAIAKGTLPVWDLIASSTHVWQAKYFMQLPMQQWFLAVYICTWCAIKIPTLLAATTSTYRSILWGCHRICQLGHTERGEVVQCVITASEGIKSLWQMANENKKRYENVNQPMLFYTDRDCCTYH